MEHTKKELIRAGLRIRYRFGNGGILAEMNQVGTAYDAKRELQEEKADCLIACWNEHDALKAKADLVDESVNCLKAALARENAYLKLIGRYCGHSGEKRGCEIQSPNYDCAKHCTLGMLSAGNKTVGVAKAETLLLKAEALK